VPEVAVKYGPDAHAPSVDGCVRSPLPGRSFGLDDCHAVVVDDPNLIAPSEQVHAGECRCQRPPLGDRVYPWLCQVEIPEPDKTPDTGDREIGDGVDQRGPWTSLQALRWSTVFQRDGICREHVLETEPEAVGELVTEPKQARRVCPEPGVEQYLLAVAWRRGDDVGIRVLPKCKPDETPEGRCYQRRCLPPWLCTEEPAGRAIEDGVGPPPSLPETTIATSESPSGVSDLQPMPTEFGLSISKAVNGPR